MIERTVPVTEDELHAYVDGELPEDRREDVEAWLAAHPEDAERIAAWGAQGDAIRALYGGVADEPVPARFDLDNLVQGRRRWWQGIAVAAALLAFAAGTASGWYGRGYWDGTPAAKVVVTEALGAHRLYIAEMRHPIEVPADASHLMNWLSKRVGQPLRAPDLQSFGLKLKGGRLLPGPRSPAALFMYEGASGERFTLYCARTVTPDTALRYRVAGQFAAFYWSEGDVSYVLSGPADRDRLQKVAEAAYLQMEKRPDPAEQRSQGTATSLVR